MRRRSPDSFPPSGTGLCIYAKRLERGRFASLWRDDVADPITLTVSELNAPRVTNRWPVAAGISSTLRRFGGP
jgi:hypothetical protein